METETPAISIPWLARIKFKMIRSGLGMIVRLLGLNFLYQFSAGFAICEWAINYRRRRRFHRRMRDYFGKEYDHRAMSRACRRYFIRTRCDKTYYLIFDMIPRDEIIRRVEFHGKEPVDASLKRGKGVYIAISHFGTNHISGLLMCFLGYKTAGVRDSNEGPLRTYIQQLFSERFSEIRAATIFYSDTLPRNIYRWFNDNGLLGSSVDTDRNQNPHLRKMPVAIFGEQREFLTGPIQIALRCQAAIHVGFLISRSRFRYEIIVTPPMVNPDQAQDNPETLHHIMSSYASILEEYLRKYPDHISRI